VKNLAFVCTTVILYSRPNWYALVKSCINVNHYVLLVRRHLKYVWFTKFTKNGPSLGISKNKKAFSFRGASPLWPPDGPYQGLCPWTPLGAPPTDPRAFPQLQICHYTTGSGCPIPSEFGVQVRATMSVRPEHAKFWDWPVSSTEVKWRLFQVRNKLDSDWLLLSDCLMQQLSCALYSADWQWLFGMYVIWPGRGEIKIHTDILFMYFRHVAELVYTKQRPLSIVRAFSFQLVCHCI